MPKSSVNASLSSYDDIFSTEESRQEEQREQVRQIPIGELFPFKNHPFKVLDDDSMSDTVESVKQYGVLSPLIARPRPKGGYEIISGHRRQHAAELAGLETLPVIVRQMDDDAAIILMVDSNLQREHILPSERACNPKRPVLHTTSVSDFLQGTGCRRSERCVQGVFGSSIEQGRASLCADQAARSGTGHCQPPRQSTAQRGGTWLMNKKKFTKLLALYLPYLVIGLAATNLGESWRLAEGKELGDKIVSLIDTLPAAFANPLPSLHPLDILVGICCGAGLRLAVYLKSKNAKKYRHGMEYGSARWSA